MMKVGGNEILEREGGRERGIYIDEGNEPEGGEEYGHRGGRGVMKRGIKRREHGKSNGKVEGDTKLIRVERIIMLCGRRRERGDGGEKGDTETQE